jgi:hypothetical protein
MAVPEAIQKLVEKYTFHRDAYLDKLVYELYGLTPEEIAIVEGK